MYRQYSKTPPGGSSDPHIVCVCVIVVLLSSSTLTCTPFCHYGLSFKLLVELDSNEVRIRLIVLHVMMRANAYVCTFYIES